MSLLLQTSRAGYGDLVLATAPNGYWPLDEGSGSWRDVAGGHDASITAAAGSAPGGIARDARPAAVLDGSTRGNNASAASQLAPQLDQSFFAWIYPTTISGDQRSIIQYFVTSNYWRLYLSGPAALRLDHVVGGTDRSVITSSGDITLNNWQHVGVTVAAGGTVTCWRNGAILGHVTTAGSAAGNYLAIGEQAGVGRRFVGRLQHLATWSRALSVHEIQTLYLAGRHGFLGVA